MIERSYLTPKKTIHLCGESDGAMFRRTFTIVRKISEGGSAVCYEAQYQNSGRGVLKEFYPQDAYALERNKEGQLVHPAEFEDAYERFLDEEKKYLEPYKMMLDARQNSDDQDLATFIPAFELYHGCDEDGNAVGTTYVWTPEPKLETFDKICDEIHRHPWKEPEHKLFTVLAAMESLTKCVRALHSADMIHRDINPSNFGFVKRGNETLTQTLSMFDINSVSSVYGDTKGAMGTPGYMEPEAGYEDADNQTDIYSIGATLFHAIVVSDETRAGGYVYRGEYYDRLREMVNESELIWASESNDHPMLRDILITILKKCLCERTYRYANCEELLADIEKALYYVLPSDIARKSISGKKWILADVERSLDKNREKNSSLAMLYHLYEHPLYQCLSKDETSINVLVVGFGNYGQKFLDACLQAGQVREKKLNVTVISDNERNKEVYLSDRPELAEFFNIDGSLADREDIYGDVIFKIRTLEHSDQAANTGILEDIMCEQHDDTRFPHYVFVALGEDRLSLNAAGACRSAAEVLEKNCAISYVCERMKAPVDNGSGLFPLLVNADIKKSELYPEIERMAFNTHLVWEKNLNVDYRLIRADFKKTYNHDSCVSNVISLKYKFNGMGIDLETTGFDEAAKLFKEKISDKKRSLKNELMWIEHRRWVTEKLCLGWRRQELKDCAQGMTKDAKAKRHVCILRSRPDQKLTVTYRTGNYFDIWDDEKSDLSRLDDLDRMSVELHRIYKDKADEARRQNLLTGNSIAVVRTLIEGDKKATVAFQEWYTCLKDIWNRDMERVSLYKGLKTSFLDALDGLPVEKRKAVCEQVKAFETMFYPVLASMEYRDWKQDDVALIDHIPFILTYTENAYMVIPYAVGSNTEVFGNVAAPTVVNPAKILYLYFVEKGEDLEELRESLPYVLEYMKKKKFKAAVEFIFIGTGRSTAKAGKNFEKEILRLGSGRIRQIRNIRSDGIEDIASDLESYLKKRSAGKRFFAVEKNDTRLSSILQGAGFYSAFPKYRFYSDRMEFRDMSDCDMLGWIRKMPYITVADTAAFRMSSSESSNQPEYFDDYKTLWEKYREDSGLWKLLCSILSEYAQKKDVLLKLKKDWNKKSAKPETYRYILPFGCKKSAEKIVSFLKEKGFAGEDSGVEGYTTDSCKVAIEDCYKYRKEYDRLFSRVYALMFSDAIAVYPDTSKREVYVTFDDLEVSGVSIAESRTAELEALMKYLKDKMYVINLDITSDGKMSFTYATRQIKELLTTAGKILEVYVYHKVKECGYFDDVVSSFEIDWEEIGSRSESLGNPNGKVKENPKSEIDCILTKGFRTLFVECKARKNIEQDFYYKMFTLADKFGINATAVLIADTQEKSTYDHAPVNVMQRKRGSMLDIVTVWKKDEIENIEKTLISIINGKYTSG